MKIKFNVGDRICFMDKSSSMINISIIRKIVIEKKVQYHLESQEFNEYSEDEIFPLRTLDQVRQINGKISQFEERKNRQYECSDMEYILSIEKLFKDNK